MSKYFYRTTLENIKDKVPSRCIPVSVALLTRDTSSVQYVSQLLHKGASYQVIPGPIYPYIHNVKEILAYVIPRTKQLMNLVRNILLDICLPFNGGVNQGQQEYYLARYLIYDCRVIGIRLNTSEYISSVFEDGTILSRYKTWEKYTKSQIILPYFIETIYKNHGIKGYKKKLTIGDFILSFRNCRISFLFESEASAIFKATRHFQYLNADILSVVADRPVDPGTVGKLDNTRYSAKSNNQMYLEEYVQRQKKIVMYAGCKLKTANELHLSNSSILQHESYCNSTDHHFLSEGEVLSNVVKIHENRKFNFKNEKPRSGNTQIPLEPLYNLEVNAMLAEIPKKHFNKVSRHYPFGIKLYGPIPNWINNIEEKMRLWFIFKHRNNSQPFLLSLPLSGYAAELDNHWRQISAYTGTNLDNYIRYYRLPGDNTYMQKGTIYDSLDLMFEQYQADRYIFFTENPSERLRQIKQSNPKIWIFRHPFITENYSNKSNEQVSIERRLDDFATQAFKRKAFTIDDLVRLNYKKGDDALTIDQLLNVIEEKLKQKLRINSTFNSYKYEIECLSREDMSMAIKMRDSYYRQEEDTVEKQSSRNESMNISREIQKVDVPQQLTEQDRFNLPRKQYIRKFFKRLAYGRQYRRMLGKRIRSICHRCKQLEERQIVHECGKCKSKTCYICIDEINRRSLKSPQAFKQCVVCRKTCYCEACQQDRRKRGGQMNEISQSPMSIQALAKRYPNLTLEQLKEKSVQQQWKLDQCQTCILNGITKPPNIKLICAKCEIEKGCYECIKRSDQVDAIRNKRWLCDKCTPVPRKTEIQRELELIRQHVQEDVQEQERVHEPTRSMQEATGRFAFQQEQEVVHGSPSHSPSPQPPRRVFQPVQEKQKSEKQKKRSESKPKERSHSPSIHEKQKSASRSRSRDKEPKKRSEKEQKHRKQDISRERDDEKPEKEVKRERSEKPLWGPRATGISGQEAANMKQAGQTGKSRNAGARRNRSPSPISQTERNRLVAGQRDAEFEDLGPIDDY